MRGLFSGLSLAVHNGIYKTAILICIPLLALAQNPNERWMQFLDPSEAGWSSEKLAVAQQIYEEIGSAAFLVIDRGTIVVSWGEAERRFMCHSVRKSLLSALFGIYVDNGTIDLATTMAELGIDDLNPLTPQEKEATIADLLKARSGVYHSAAYETSAMKKARPSRGSHAHNTFWYYNNWDFNTLCHILMKYSGRDFFEDFKETFAEPLQMEHFRLEDCYYHLEPEHSLYPAYPFRLSARDLARMGQLFLQNGQWNGEEILSPDWVAESTFPYSENTRTEGRGYAYLWWTGIYGNEHKNYSMQGVGNQAVIVYPEDDIILVNRTNTFRRERVTTEDLVRLTNAVLAAKVDEGEKHPLVKPVSGETHFPAHYVLDPKQMLEFIGPVLAQDGGEARIVSHSGRLQINLSNNDKYYLLPTGQDQFTLEDAHFIIDFERGENGKLTRRVSVTR